MGIQLFSLPNPQHVVFLLFLTLCLAQNKVRLLIIAPQTACPDFGFLDSRFETKCRDSLLETDCDVLRIHRTKDTLDDIFANVFFLIFFQSWVELFQWIGLDRFFSTNR